MSALINAIRHLRPAPVQVWLFNVLGLNKRRDVGFRDATFYIDPTNDLGSRIGEGYETEMLAAVDKYLRPGAVFLDLGANEGFFSVLGSLAVGPKGRVVAVEPQGRLMPVIKRNLAVNNCDNCQLEKCVVSDKDGELVIHLASAANTGGTSLFRSSRYAVPTETVKSWLLTDFLAHCDLDVVDFVKIDVEGAEYDIIMPAGDVLRSGRLRNIALEYHPSVLAMRGKSMDEMHALLTTSGYRLNESCGVSVYEFAGEPG